MGSLNKFPKERTFKVKGTTPHFKVLNNQDERPLDKYMIDEATLIQTSAKKARLTNKEYQEKVVANFLSAVSPDAEKVSNTQGGEQSATDFAVHFWGKRAIKVFYELSKGTPYESIMLALFDWADNRTNIEKARLFLRYTLHWREYDIRGLNYVADDIPEYVQRVTELPFLAILDVAKRLHYGHYTRGYPRGNWKLIPAEEHLNHCLIHLGAAIAGDVQDDHGSAVVCRAMMFYECLCREIEKYGGMIRAQRDDLKDREVAD